MEFFNNSVFFGVMLSLLAYGIGALLKQKFKLAIFNPLLIAVIIVIAVLAVSGIDYKVYNEGAKYISYLLTPATICHGKNTSKACKYTTENTDCNCFPVGFQ